MPKTSRIEREQEYQVLRVRSINGRLSNWPDIRRLHQLQLEFGNTPSKRVKTLENS